MSAQQNERPVAWVDFDDNAAILKRLIAPGDIRGLILRTTDTDAGNAVRERALTFGFVEPRTRGTLRIFFQGGTTHTITDLANALGGRRIALPRADLLSEKWTLNLSPRAQVPALEAGPARITLDPAKVQPIGVNVRGEDVVRDDKGRFYHRIIAENGSSEFIHESSGDRPPLFLRATRPEDLEVIASSLVVMASRGTLHMSDFSRVVTAALEEGPHGRLDMSQRDAEESVRQFMMREITAIAVENDASREKFTAALRVASAAGFVLSRRTESGGMLSPSPAMAAFLRRQTRGQSAVDFRGHDDMRVGLPRLMRDNAALQVHDLAGIPQDGLSGYSMNILARRAAEGRTILRIPLDAGLEIVDRLRAEIGRNYALETVAEINAAVADGVQDGNPSTVFFIGERRPEPLEALPQAAMRTFGVLTTDDLMNLERDITRARGKIRDFHQGVEDSLGAQDGREENIRQKPYQPLSRVKEPFTMIPVALEGATAKALDRVRRDCEDRGGVDAVVAAALGQSIDGLGEILTAEQVDAIAMRINAHERGRGFLLSDQTGVGKGRSLAAMAMAHLRSGPGKKVLYFTESAQINAPDVCRDLVDVGAWADLKPTFLSTGSQFTYPVIDPETGVEYEKTLSSPPPAARKALMESETWPDDVNMVITTYSQFRGKEEDMSSIWLRNALDEDTLIIMDEAHNALNDRSLQGKNGRAAIEAVGFNHNVIYGTATPSRDPSGMNLYKPLLPLMAAEGLLDALLDNIKEGGEVSQEAFATMLAEDGVLLRRDHDLSNIEFRVSLPDDARMIQYQAVMNRFSPVVEMMIECSSQIGDHMGRRQSRDYQAALARGVSREAARAMSNEMNQYSIALGSPLSNLARITMNAIKIDQVVDEAMLEIQEGRKPLITFHSTNSALLDEMSRDADGNVSDEIMANAGNLTLKDQIRRIHNGMYKVKIEGETRDARDVYQNVRETSAVIEARIDEIPDNMPVSPVDALVERLEAHGIAVGEISGRTLSYRDNRIQRRAPEDRNKRRVIDRFNAGELDVLVYNSAGATGGSYHASPKFADQRPRTMIELEAPLDVIKYVQGQGRGNRYGQVANPRVKSVMTGLTPEMRILQQRNKKLRSLGASVDGNRSHPMLLDDIPDLLNKVGDEATRNVLVSMPAMARRLGFPQYAEEQNNTPQRGARGVREEAVDTGSGSSDAGLESLSNKVLARSIMLTAADQDDLVQRIRMEFDALIEELESRNANPLRPKELEGQIEIRATTIYSGIESEDGDLDTSAFLSPLYISTAIHHYNEEAWSGDRLVTEIEATRRLYGAEGFAPFAERIQQNLPALMRSHLPEGMDMAEALATPGNAGNRFETRHRRITDLAWLLDNMRPGVSVRYPEIGDYDAVVNRTIVGLSPPSNPMHYEVPSAYKIRTIAPGRSKPEVISLSRLLSMDMQRIFFRPGLSENFTESYLEEFNRETLLTRRLPVQILSGNILQAITESTRHDLGTVSLYRDMEGHVHRGIVVSKGKVDLKKLPVPVAGGRIAAEMGFRFMDGQEAAITHGMMKFWGSMDPLKEPPAKRIEADCVVTLTPRTFSFDLQPLRKSNEEFYRSRPGLYEAMYEKPLPEPEDVPVRAFRRPGKEGRYHVKFPITDAVGKNRAMTILGLLGDMNLLTDGNLRSVVNDIQIDLQRILGERRAFDVPEEEIDADPEHETPEAGDGEDIPDPADEAEADADEEEVDFGNVAWN